MIDGLLSRRVDLPSGGYLMIDYAEALTVIDVNSGSFVGRGKGARLEDTITKTNLEAAEEVVNQLRLRDIGGIIVIDFIDMARARNRDAVLKTLRKALDEDRTKTFTAEISRLGLVEMTRQNVTEGVREIMSRPCPTCHGDGVIRSEETIAIEFERRLRDVARRARRGGGVPRADEPARDRRVHRPRRARCCTRSRSDTGRSFHFEGSEGLALDHFAITFQGTRAEVEERALPFRQGDEVLVEIVEPHMYAADDAVAKIDGYIISIAAAPGSSARSGWCASKRSGAPPRARCRSTSPARSIPPPARARQRAAGSDAAAARVAPQAPARRSPREVPTVRRGEPRRRPRATLRVADERSRPPRTRQRPRRGR